MIEELWLVFKAHKGPVGLFLGSAAAGCLFASHRMAAGILGALSIFLLGSGYLASDREEEERQGTWISRPWDR